jgi:hypothetical protein
MQLSGRQVPVPRVDTFWVFLQRGQPLFNGQFRENGLSSSAMTREYSDRTRSIQKRLRLVLAGTLFISFALRLLAPGLMLFLFWILLALIALVHVIVHIRAMKRVPFTAARYRFMIWCSHILFFLGFVFQVDGLDASYGRAPILFWMLLSPTDDAVQIFNTVSIGSFILLSLSWLLLESVPMPRKPPR